jgi:hypothetical protein
MKWYYKLIKTRKPLIRDDAEYYEKHHIIPKCFGGSDDKLNLIKLTAREHFIAHLLLAKGTCHPKMIKGIHKMVYSNSPTNNRNYKINSKIYEYVRIQHAKIVSAYSKNTVTCFDVTLGVYRRVPSVEFNQYKNILYTAPNKNRKFNNTTVLKRNYTKLPFLVYINGNEQIKYNKNIVVSIYNNTFNIKRITSLTIKKYEKLLQCCILPGVNATSLTQYVYDCIKVYVKPHITDFELKKYLNPGPRNTSNANYKQSRESRTTFTYNTPTGVYKSRHDLKIKYPWMTDDVILSVQHNKKIGNSVVYKNNIPQFIGSNWNDIGFVFTR